MNWQSLTDIAQLDAISAESHSHCVAIFKHSTRCSISHMAKGRLDRSEPIENVPFYYLDLISHRDISAKIEEQFKVHHESPQIILLRNGECIYAESHNGIMIEEIVEQVSIYS